MLPQKKKETIVTHIPARYEEPADGQTVLADDARGDSGIGKFGGAALTSLVRSMSADHNAP